MIKILLWTNLINRDDKKTPYRQICPMNIVIMLVMGFEIIGAQAQDTSPNVGIKNGHSTSNRPLVVSLKGKPKTRAQLAPLKG